MLAVKCKVIRRGCGEIAQSHPFPHPGHAGPGPLALTEATSLLLGPVQSPQGASLLLPAKVPPPGSRRPCSLTWPCPLRASPLAPTWVPGAAGPVRQHTEGRPWVPAQAELRTRAWQGHPREESQGLRAHRQAAHCTAVRGRAAAQQCRPRTGCGTRTHPHGPAHKSPARPPFPALPVARPWGGVRGPGCPGASLRAHRLELPEGQPQGGRLWAEGAPE